LPEAALRRFYAAIDQADNLQHRILLRLLLFTGLRVAELAAILVADVDLGEGKIYIEQGKGSKDRYVLFRDDFRLTLAAYIQGLPPRQTILFESRQRRPYSPERIRQLIRDYAADAGITDRVYPHLLRHQLLTLLTKEGVPDAAIQLISGHSSRESLKIYQHLALPDVAEDYQRAVHKLPEGI
jgi:site-specific recombinase XerD